MSQRATPAQRNLTRAECDNCGNDLFIVHFSKRLLVLECEACGCELTERLS